MANQTNFKSNLAIASLSGQKFTVSRTVETLSDALVRAEVPTNFPVNLNNIAIEFNVYSLFDNVRIYSGYIKNTTTANPISVNTLVYSNGTKRTLLYIDFSKAPEVFLPTGKYQITLNIFADVIGSYDDKVLRITKISPSRREVELEHTNPTLQNIDKIKNYVQHTISSDWIYIALQQIFNQTGADTQYIPASNVGMTTSSVLFTLDPSSSLSTYKFDVDSIEGKPGVNTLTKQILDRAYLITTQSLVRDIASGTSSFTAKQIYGYVTTSLRTAYDELLVDEATNPTKYRFDLI